jgi:hypothetical protein
MGIRWGIRKVHCDRKVSDRMDFNENVTKSLVVEQIKLLQVLTSSFVPANTSGDASLLKAVLKVSLCRWFFPRGRCLSLNVTLL